VHVHKRFGREVTVNYYPNAKAQQCSLTCEMRVQQGTLADYKLLSQFHYRSGRCPPSRRIFALKRGDELCGVAVYSYPSPLCFGRSKVWKGSLKELQRDVSVVSRVVVHPKFRGIGLGEKLIAETLSKCGTPCVEAVAVMARYNPFFEHAGMQRIAESKPSAAVTDALAGLERLGFDVALLPCAGYVEKHISLVGCGKIVALLETLSLQDAAVRKRLADLQSVYPKHEEFALKLRGLDAANLAQVLKRLNFLAQKKVYLFWKKTED
jgi:GNAT superfamily N-acetyltransferase